MNFFVLDPESDLHLTTPSIVLNFDFQTGFTGSRFRLCPGM